LVSLTEHGKHLIIELEHTKEACSFHNFVGDNEGKTKRDMVLGQHFLISHDKQSLGQGKADKINPIYWIPESVDPWLEDFFQFLVPEQKSSLVGVYFKSFREYFHFQFIW